MSERPDGVSARAWHRQQVAATRGTPPGPKKPKAPSPRKRKRVKWLADVLDFQLEKRSEYPGLDIRKTKNNPPHWFLESGDMNAVLQKGGKKTLRERRWQLLVKGLPPLFFPSRRAALDFFVRLTNEDLEHMQASLKKKEEAENGEG